MRKRGRQVPLLAEHVTLQRVRLRMTGVALEGVGERGSRGLEIAARRCRLRASDGLVCRARWRRRGLPRRGALLLQRGAERVVTLAQLGIDLERAFELRDRSAEIAGLPQCLAELVVHGRIAGFGLGDATKVIQCGVEVSLLAERHAQVEVCVDGPGLEGQGLPEHLHGFVELAALRERRAEVRVRARVLRVERDGLAQHRDALGEVRPVEQHDAEPVVGLGRSGSHFHGALQPFEGARILSALEIRHAERDVEFRIVGILRECLLQLRHGIGRGPGLWRGRT